jgi:hypothetical protein
MVVGRIVGKTPLAAESEPLTAFAPAREVSALAAPLAIPVGIFIFYKRKALFPFPQNSSVSLENYIFLDKK